MCAASDLSRAYAFQPLGQARAACAPHALVFYAMTEAGTAGQDKAVVCLVVLPFYALELDQ